MRQVDIIALRIPREWRARKLDAYRGLLGERNYRRFDAFARPIDANANLIGELLVRRRCLSMPGLPPDLALEYSPWGKPFLPHENAEAFSISHSGDVVAAAFAEAAVEIGLDVEAREPFDWRPVADRFHADETEAIHRCREPDRLREFYRIWTLKEAYSKALGLGLRLPWNRFSVLDPDSHSQPVDFGTGYAGGLCHASGPARATLIWLDFDGFLSDLNPGRAKHAGVT